jgi:hypothetical protein
MSNRVPILLGALFTNQNVSDRNGEINMPHAGTANPGGCHQNTAAITNSILEAFFLILTASAFVVPFRAEDAFTEQANLFRV